MSHKNYAIIFGIVFIIIGLLGFVPMLTPNGYLFNVFETGYSHNALYVLTGIIALIVAVNSYASKIFFQIFAVVYLALAVLGFMLGGNLFFMHLNVADNLFHLIAGGIAAGIGYGKRRVLQQEGLVKK